VQLKANYLMKEKKLPSKKILLKRQLKVYPSVAPLLIAGWGYNEPTDFTVTVPQLTQKGELLADFYELSFKLNENYSLLVKKDKLHRQISLF